MKQFCSHAPGFDADDRLGIGPAGRASGNAEHGKKLYQRDRLLSVPRPGGPGRADDGPARVTHGICRSTASSISSVIPPTRCRPMKRPIVSDKDAADIYAYLRQMPAPPDPNSIPLLKVTR